MVKDIQYCKLLGNARDIPRIAIKLKLVTGMYIPLESLGKPQENYGVVLVPIVLEKLPCDIREHLARQHGDDDWLLSDLRYAIFKEINIKEAGASSMVQPKAEL